MRSSHRKEEHSVGPSKRFGDRLDDPVVKCVPGSSVAVMLHDHGGFCGLIQGSGAFARSIFELDPIFDCRTSAGFTASGRPDSGPGPSLPATPRRPRTSNRSQLGCTENRCSLGITPSGQIQSDQLSSFIGAKSPATMGFHLFSTPTMPRFPWHRRTSDPQGASPVETRARSTKAIHGGRRASAPGDPGDLRFPSNLATYGVTSCPPGVEAEEQTNSQTSQHRPGPTASDIDRLGRDDWHSNGKANT